MHDDYEGAFKLGTTREHEGHTLLLFPLAGPNGRERAALNHSGTVPEAVRHGASLQPHKSRCWPTMSFTAKSLRILSNFNGAFSAGHVITNARCDVVICTVLAEDRPTASHTHGRADTENMNGD